MTHETEEGDLLFAVAYEAMEELDKAQKEQDRLQDEPEATRESMDIASREFTNCWAHLNTAFREVSNCRALHDVTWVDLKRACQWTAELKRKADDAHERTRSSEAAINLSLGCIGWFVKETANATHSLTCGVPDRESNETNYLRKVTEMIEEWQRRIQRGHCAVFVLCVVLHDDADGVGVAHRAGIDRLRFTPEIVLQLTFCYLSTDERLPGGLADSKSCQEVFTVA